MIRESNTAMERQSKMIDSATPPRQTKEHDKVTQPKQEDIECLLAAKSMNCIPKNIDEAEGIRSLLSAAELFPGVYLRSSTSTQSLSHMSRDPRRQHTKVPKRTPRDHRPMYSQEEADAILYLRDSVGLPWKKVVELWNLLFDALTGKRWGPRTISGLQSHYYRMLGIDKSHGRRSSAPNPDIGLLKATNRRYWWVYGSQPSILKELACATPDQLKAAQKQNIRRLRREAHKEGRRQRKITRRTENENFLQLQKALPSARLEEPKDPKFELGWTNNSDSDSSMGDSFDQHSVSDVDEYDTSSVAPPPSSQTSAPASPFEGFEFEAQAPRRLSEDLQNKSNLLPSFENLSGLADRGASVAKINARKHNIIRWQDRVETLQRSSPERVDIAPLRLTNKNPMAVASLLT